MKIFTTQARTFIDLVLMAKGLKILLKEIEYLPGRDAIEALSRMSEEGSSSRPTNLYTRTIEKMCIELLICERESTYYFFLYILIIFLNHFYKL